jgi:preprotein translocase subunit SecF
MIWGIFVATASSIFIGGPILIYFNIRPRPGDATAETSGDAAGQKTRDTSTVAGA